MSNRQPSRPIPIPRAQSGGQKKRGSIDLTLYIRAAQELGLDPRKVRKGTNEYEKIMKLKNKMKSTMDDIKH